MKPSDWPVVISCPECACPALRGTHPPAYEPPHAAAAELNCIQVTADPGACACRCHSAWRFIHHRPTPATGTDAIPPPGGTVSVGSVGPGGRGSARSGTTTSGRAGGPIPGPSMSAHKEGTR